VSRPDPAAPELAHELRQPLAAAKGLMQLLLARGSASPDDLRAVLEQLQALERILARWQGGPAAAPAPLDAPVQAAVHTLAGRALAREVQLALDLGGDSAPLIADPVAVQQIVTNLVANALDAARTEVRVRLAGGVLEVKDDGPGIAAEHATRLFEPYFTTKADQGGTGLGLSITRDLAAGLGAALSWDTGPAGTAFTVAFPPLRLPAARLP
jgi:signal transduction histidine kinase